MNETKQLFPVASKSRGGRCGAGEYLCSDNGTSIRVPLVEEMARLIDAYAAGTPRPNHVLIWIALLFM